MHFTPSFAFVAQLSARLPGMTERIENTWQTNKKAIFRNRVITKLNRALRYRIQK